MFYFYNNKEKVFCKKEGLYVYVSLGVGIEPGTGQPGGLQSTGSQRVGHNWSDLAAAAAAYSLENIRIS